MTTTPEPSGRRASWANWGSLSGTYTDGEYILTAGGSISDLVEVSAQITAPREIAVIAVKPDTLTISLLLESVRGAGFTCRSLEVVAHDGHEVSGEILRTIPVQRWAQIGFRLCLGFRETDYGGVIYGASYDGGAVFPDWVRQEWPNGKNRDIVLRYSAVQYQRAVVLGHPPTKAVQVAMNVSRATASRIVAAARKEGILVDQIGTNDHG